MKYEIQHFTLCGWINTWTSYDEEDNEMPSVFDSYETAQSALHMFLKDDYREYALGNIESPEDAADFRIIKIEGVTA